jgi:hypothetical protein
MLFPISCVVTTCCVALGVAVAQWYDRMQTDDDVAPLFQICFAKAPAKLRRDKNAMPNSFGKMMTSTKRKPIMSFLQRLQNIRIDKNGPKNCGITVLRCHGDW